VLGGVGAGRVIGAEVVGIIRHRSSPVIELSASLPGTGVDPGSRKEKCLFGILKLIRFGVFRA
jgi:hypothetical protein